MSFVEKITQIVTFLKSYGVFADTFYSSLLEVLQRNIVLFLFDVQRDPTRRTSVNLNGQC